MRVSWEHAQLIKVTTSPGDLSSDNKFKLKMQHVTNNTTAADINGWIDYAVANKVWLIIMFHNVRAGAETTGAANAQCIEPVTDANGNRSSSCTIPARCRLHNKWCASGNGRPSRYTARWNNSDYARSTYGQFGAASG
jgi:hypothetical protein